MPCELEDNEGDHENQEWYGTSVISSIFIIFKMVFYKEYYFKNNGVLYKVLFLYYFIIITNFKNLKF